MFPGSIAFAQAPPQTAPVNGLTIMPAQLSPNTWGCYLMDAENQTLSVYQFFPADRGLILAASREIRYDRHLGFFNTSPPPGDVKAMVEKAAEPRRAVAPKAISPEETKP